MIILDTNVVSEPMRRRGTQAVLDWLDQQASATLFLTTISLAELWVGVAYMPDGRRKTSMESGMANLLDTLFGNRILPFDEAAANAYVRLSVRARTKGKAISFAERQIAAIAAAHGFTVATRDIRPFEAAGVSVINPFDEVASPG